jgi:hypothetical protein
MILLRESVFNRNTRESFRERSNLLLLLLLLLDDELLLDASESDLLAGGAFCFFGIVSVTIKSPFFVPSFELFTSVVAVAVVVVVVLVGIASVSTAFSGTSPPLLVLALLTGVFGSEAMQSVHRAASPIKARLSCVLEKDSAVASRPQALQVGAAAALVPAAAPAASTTMLMLVMVNVLVLRVFCEWLL